MGVNSQQGGATLPTGTVTFLFTDVEGSTRLLKQLGDGYRRVLADHERLLRSSFARFGGHVVDTQGDAFFVAFQAARSALQAAAAGQADLARHEWPAGAELRVRMGVHSGEPDVGGGRYLGLGVHKAARLCSAGHGGQVLVSSATRELVVDDLPAGFRLRDLGDHRLKDFDHPERVFQLVGDDLPPTFRALAAPRVDAGAGSVPAPGLGELYGREEELARVGRFVEAGASGRAVLVLEGEPGIGKSVLWHAGVEQAREAGFRVLVTRPAEAESSLSFSALGDLFADVGGAIDALPAPQRRAIRIALLLEETGGGSTDPRALAVAVLGLLRELARERPLLLAVDDVQWLDPASAAALAFALRRLDDDDVALIGSARPRATQLPVEAQERVVVGPLDLIAVGHVIRSVVGTRVPRPVLRRIYDVSSGNPFYARELARALVRRQDASLPPASLPLPQTLSDVVGERIAALSPAAREVLLAVAALSNPTPELVAAAVDDPDALQSARAEHVLVVEGDRVRLDHPLLGSVASEMVPPERVQALHRRLARIVGEPEDRARHLALAATGPDEQVASALEQAARGARSRGAVETAAELAELAIHLTPPGDAKAVRRRRALGGDCHFAAGDAERADELLEEVVAATDSGSERARALWRLGAVRAALAGPAMAFPLYDRALAESGDDARLRAQIHDRLATWKWMTDGVVAAEPHALALVELAERVGEPRLCARAIGAALAIEVLQGQGLDRVRYRRMLALERQAPDEGGDFVGGALHHHLLMWAGAYEEARERFAELVDQAHARSPTSEILPLFCAAHGDLVTANWQAGLEKVNRSLDLIDQTGRDALVAGTIALRSLIRVHLGDIDGATADARTGEELAVRSGQTIHAILARLTFAELALVTGDVRKAAAAFAANAETIARRGEHGTGEWWMGDEVEARVAVRDFDGAERRLEPFEIVARRSGQPRSVATADRARGVLAFARGDTDDAFTYFDDALERLSAVDDRYQVGRTLLCLGTVQRRLGQKAIATATLRRALDALVSVHAELWSERTRSELARIGGRPTSTNELTETERQVAQLVASGRSNAEAAQVLSVSPRTVEWNLSKIYRKLGVASRTELSAKLARHPV